eukprot:CCRYP_020848-RA/>CCRYP_020848-RA protein AED:0.46 eAED:0.46 QI:0/-1/0/1/-1/1/1/0/76
MTCGDYQTDDIVVGKYYYMDEIDDCLDEYFENEDAIDYLDFYYYGSYYTVDSFTVQIPLTILNTRIISTMQREKGI